MAEGLGVAVGEKRGELGPFLAPDSCCVLPIPGWAPPFSLQDSCQPGLSSLLSFWAWVTGRECVADLHSARPRRHCADPSKEHIAFDPEPQGESHEGGQGLWEDPAGGSEHFQNGTAKLGQGSENVELEAGRAGCLHFCPQPSGLWA